MAPSYGRNGALPETYGSTRLRTRDLTLLGWGTAPKKPVNRELPEKLLNTTQLRQRQKVAQRGRGSDEPKKS